MSLVLIEKYIEYRNQKKWFNLNLKNKKNDILSKFNKEKVFHKDLIVNNKFSQYLIKNYSQEDIVDYANVVRVLFANRGYMSSLILSNFDDALKHFDYKMPNDKSVNDFVSPRKIASEKSLEQSKNEFMSFLQENPYIQESWMRIIHKYEPGLLIKSFEDEELVGCLISLQNGKLTDDDWMVLANKNQEYKSIWLSNFIEDKKTINIGKHKLMKRVFHIEFKNYDFYMARNPILANVMDMLIVCSNNMDLTKDKLENLKKFIRNFELMKLSTDGFYVYINQDGVFDKNIQPFNVFDNSTWKTLSFMSELNHTIPKNIKTKSNLIKF